MSFQESSPSGVTQGVFNPPVTNCSNISEVFSVGETHLSLEFQDFY